MVLPLYRQCTAAVTSEHHQHVMVWSASCGILMVLPFYGQWTAAVTREHHQHVVVYSWYFPCIGSLQQQCTGILVHPRHRVDELEVHYSSWKIIELWAWLVSRRGVSMTSENHQHDVVYSWYLPCIGSLQQQWLVSIINMLWYTHGASLL